MEINKIFFYFFDTEIQLCPNRARVFARVYISVMGIRCSEDFLTLICKVVSISVFTSTEIEYSVFFEKKIQNIWSIQKKAVPLRSILGIENFDTQNLSVFKSFSADIWKDG